MTTLKRSCGSTWWRMNAYVIYILSWSMFTFRINTNYASYNLLPLCLIQLFLNTCASLFVIKLIFVVRLSCTHFYVHSALWWCSRSLWYSIQDVRIPMPMLCLPFVPVEAFMQRYEYEIMQFLCSLKNDNADNKSNNKREKWNSIPYNIFSSVYHSEEKQY